jgi:hypothetical protein
MLRRLRIVLTHLFVCSMAADGRVEKAAAIAVFNSRIKLAITLLSKFQQSGLADSSANLTASSTLNLKLVAMALSGYTDGGSPLWRASSEPLRQSMSDPYINAIFSFLCNTKPDYWAVLQESDVSLRDKIAFACRFLDDERVRLTLFVVAFLCAVLTLLAREKAATIFRTNKSASNCAGPTTWLALNGHR